MWRYAEPLGQNSLWSTRGAKNPCKLQQGARDAGNQTTIDYRYEQIGQTVILPSGSSLDSIDSPAATLVIISHNRPKLRDLAIRSALDSMANARVKLPIVVIDSTKVPGPTPPGIHLMHRPDAPTCVAKRRLAVETSQTKWVLMLDDDCQVVPDGIGRMLSAIAAEDGNLTGAIFVVTEFSGEQTWMFRAASHSDLLLGFGDTAETGDITWAITTFSAFRRSAVLNVDAFSWDEFPLQAGGEDVDACMRLRAGGWKLRGLPDTLARHDTQTWDSFGKNARRSRNYGAAEGELVRLHPRRTRLGWENLLVSIVLQPDFVTWRSGLDAERPPFDDHGL